MNETDYRRHIEILASDEFGGRAPASPGEVLTVNYLVNAFTELGLEPANGDSYTQDVPLAWVELTNNPDLQIKGGDGDDLAITYATEQVMWTRRQQPESSVDDSEMIFVGYGINAPERGWNDYAGVDVKGKTVVMLINDPGYATQDPELFNGNAMTYYGRWDYKFGEAARQGAAGAIMIHAGPVRNSTWYKTVTAKTCWPWKPGSPKTVPWQSSPRPDSTWHNCTKKPVSAASLPFQWA